VDEEGVAEEDVPGPAGGQRRWPAEIGSFVADGFVAVRGAVLADVLRTCQEEIWSALAAAACCATTRSRCGIRWRVSPAPERGVRCRRHPAGPVGAFDQLIGEGRWWRRRGVGGVAKYDRQRIKPVSTPPTLVIADQGQTALAVTPVTSAWATTHQRTEYPFLQNRRHDRHQARIRPSGGSRVAYGNVP